MELEHRCCALLCAAGRGDGDVQRVCLASLCGAVVRKEVLGTSFKGDGPVVLVEQGREGRGECFCFSVLKIAEGCLPSQEWWNLIILSGKKRKNERNSFGEGSWDPVLPLLTSH